MAENDIRALRAAGHDEAADLLEDQAAKRQRAEAQEEAARQGPGSTTPAGLRMMPDSAYGVSPGDAEAAAGMLKRIENLKAGQQSVPLFDKPGGRR